MTSNILMHTASSIDPALSRMSLAMKITAQIINILEILPWLSKCGFLPALHYCSASPNILKPRCGTDDHIFGLSSVSDLISKNADFMRKC